MSVSGELTPQGGTITSVVAGTGLTGGATGGVATLDLADTAVTPGTYAAATVAVDQQGRVTAASATTLAAVATSGSASDLTTGTLPAARIASGSITAAKLANTAVTPATYSNATVTVDAQGRITGASNGSPGQVLAISVTQSPYNAVGDGVTDDQAAIQAATTAAIAAGTWLHFPALNYKISKFIDVYGANNLHISGKGATIVYPSDDVSVVASGHAAADNQARSAFYMSYCSNVHIQGLTFQGGTNPSFDLINTGVGIYQTHCQDTTVFDCTGLDGNALHQQDAQVATSTTGDSLAVASGVMTLTSSAALFKPAHVGRQITIAAASDQRNNGVFVITAYVSATQIKYANSAGQSETSSLSWSVDDGDRNTLIDGCTSRRCRSTMTVAPHSKIVTSWFEQPMTPDITGIPSKFVSGSPTIMSAVNGSWNASAVGKYVLVQGSTSAANDGLYKITAVTAKSRFAPATLSYTNGSAVTEAAASTSTFCIFGGEKTGKGNGATALALSTSTMTLTASANSFSAADVGKIVRIAGATTAANNGAFIITAAPSATTITWTNALGHSETYSGAWSIDGYDAAGGSGAAFGSTHAIYVFAGREDIEVADCTFVGIRKNCVKASGSALPMRNINVHHNTAVECGALFDAGADDAQEHSELHCDNNTLIDVATGRPGWSEAVAITFLGSKGGTANGNQFLYTRPAISTVDGRATQAGLYAIQATRYASGKTQPLEDFSACDNKATADRVNTRTGLLCSSMVSVIECGIVNYWGGSGSSFTFSTPTVTLLDGSAAWSQDLVGSKIQIVGATSSGNNGTFTILAVTGTGSLTYSNASGVAEAFPSYAAYRIKRLVGARGGTLRLSRNECDGAASNCISTSTCVAPEINDNIANYCSIVTEAGSLTPRIRGNRLVSPVSASAHMQIGSTTSWPIVDDNLTTYGALSGGALGTNEIPAAPRGDVGLGVDNFTRVDHPLLGTHGRCLVTGAHAELLIAFGSLLVEGDTISVNGNALIFTNNPSPGAGKFNTFNDTSGTNHSLIQRASALTGMTAEDYGSTLSSACSTGHIRCHGTATTASADVYYIDTINVLNATALVVPRNRVAANESIQYSMGEGSIGPTATRLVVWSPLVNPATPIIQAENAAAAALAAGGWYPEKSTNNSGVCVPIVFVTVNDGTEEFSWRAP